MLTNNAVAPLQSSSPGVEAAPPARPIPRSHQPLWEILAALFLALIAHHTVIYGTFHQDDEAIINAANIKAKEWENRTGLAKYAWDYWRERPLYYLSLVVNDRFGKDPEGKDIPFGFHLFNLIGHLMAVAGLYVLVARIQMRCHRLLRARGMGPDALAPGWGAVRSYLPLLAAFLFAVHPVASEPVAYVMARANGWGGAFFLWSWAFFIKAFTPRRRLGIIDRSVLRQGFHFALGLFFLLLAWAFKETHVLMAVLFPISLLLTSPAFVGAWRKERIAKASPGSAEGDGSAAEPEGNAQAYRRTGGPSVLPKGAAVAALTGFFIALSGAMVFVFFKVSRGFIHRVLYDFPIEPEVMLPSQAVIVLWNWFRMLIPYKVSLEYDFLFREMNDPLSWACLWGNVLWVAGAVYFGRRRPWLIVAVLMYYVTLAPTNSVLLRFDLWSDRNGYLAAAAGCVVLAGCFQELALRMKTLDSYARPVFAGRGWAAVSFFVIWVAALAYLTHSRDKLYADPIAFWADTVAKAPTHPRAHLQYAYILDSVDRTDEAHHHYQTTVNLIDGLGLDGKRENLSEMDQYFGHSHWALWRSLAETRLAQFDMERARRGGQDYDYVYDAEERLYLACRDNPGDPAPLAELIRLHFFMKELDSVEEDFEEAYEDGCPLLPKEEVELRVQLVRSYLLKKDPDNALRCLEALKALTLPLSAKEEEKLRTEIASTKKMILQQQHGD